MVRNISVLCLYGGAFFRNLCISVYYIKTIAHTHITTYLKFHNIRVLTKNTFCTHHPNTAILRDPGSGKNRDIKIFSRVPIHTRVSPLFTGHQVMRAIVFLHIWVDMDVLNMHVCNNTQCCNTVKP